MCRAMEVESDDPGANSQAVPERFDTQDVLNLSQKQQDATCGAEGTDVGLGAHPFPYRRPRRSDSARLPRSLRRRGRKQRGRIPPKASLSASRVERSRTSPPGRPMESQPNRRRPGSHHRGVAPPRSARQALCSPRRIAPLALPSACSVRGRCRAALARRRLAVEAAGLLSRRPSRVHPAAANPAASQHVRGPWPSPHSSEPPLPSPARIGSPPRPKRQRAHRAQDAACPPMAR